MKRSLVWADENRFPLACENLDEDDLINKVSVGPVVVHHQYHASQLKSSFSSSKDLPFGPKYTGEGKIDFYEQNKKERHFEEEKEEAPLYEVDVNLREPSRKATSGVTRANDLSSYNKNPHPKKHSKVEGEGQPQYQRTILGQTDMNSQPAYPSMPNYMNQKENNASYTDPNTVKSSSFHKDDPKQQQDLFHKPQTDPSDKYKHGSTKSKLPATGLPHSMAQKSKNMHTKINRGISPNQPPASMKNKSRTNTKNRIGKYPPAEQTGGPRRSSSLKVKEKDRIHYNKPSPSSRINQKPGGSFLAPAGPSGKSERTRKSKAGTSAAASKPGYPKAISNMSGSGSNGQCNYECNFENRHPANKNMQNSNFTANPRIRKSNNNPPAVNNTMASFRSGPVKVVGTSSNASRETRGDARGEPGRDNNRKNPHKSHIKSSLNESRKGPMADSRKIPTAEYRKGHSKDGSKRPSSASKATNPKSKSSKIVSKVPNRPGTASTRTASTRTSLNRPPSPGSRTLKSDLLFSSYKYK